MGDFNYRIGLGSEKVKQLIKNNDLETLYENDQVCSIIHVLFYIPLINPSSICKWLLVLPFLITQSPESLFSRPTNLTLGKTHMIPRKCDSTYPMILY
jgi:hypothetical protein